jgi:SAM-dependent methyltransferase
VAAAGLAGRIEIRHGDVTRLDTAGDFDLAYFQYALHHLSDPPGALRTAWTAVRPGGRLLVLDWALPSSLDEFRTRQGELIASVQLDELYQGTALATPERFLGWFSEASLPVPAVIDLPSGATIFVVEHA